MKMEVYSAHWERIIIGARLPRCSIEKKTGTKKKSRFF